MINLRNNCSYCLYDAILSLFTYFNVTGSGIELKEDAGLISIEVS